MALDKNIELWYNIYEIAPPQFVRFTPLVKHGINAPLWKTYKI